MRTILSIILILASIGGFVGFVMPVYSDIQQISAQKADYSEVLANARVLAEKRDSLLKIYNDIQPSDMDRLERMLPSNPDNVKLILEIEAVAKTYGLVLQNVKIGQADDTPGQRPKSGSAEIGTLTLDFSTAGSYPGYVGFINTLEKNLRIMNIKKVSFIAPADKSSYQYQTSIETYWIK